MPVPAPLELAAPAAPWVETLTADAMAVLFVSDAYKHCKARWRRGRGTELLLNHNGARRAPATVGEIEEGVVSAPTVRRRGLTRT